MSVVDPPAHLSTEAAELWHEVLSEHDLDGAGLAQFAAGLEQLDVYRRCMEDVHRDGATVVNPKSGVSRQNPALSAAHASLRAARQTFAALGISDSKVYRSPGGHL